MSNFTEEIEKRSGIKAAECYQCGKCSAGCPIAFEMDSLPSRIIRLVQLGAKDEALRSRTIWLCASCETCTTRCPMNIEIAELMNVLREMALEMGVANKSEKNIIEFGKAFLRSVKKNGRVAEVMMINDYKMRRPMTALQDLSVAPKLMAKKKLSFRPHAIKGQETVERIFKNCEKHTK